MYVGIQETQNNIIIMSSVYHHLSLLLVTDSPGIHKHIHCVPLATVPTFTCVPKKHAVILALK